ncbi:S-adenosyl-L-methionine-dependent methyltransferase [Hypomontagnella submonticulosa]|nr:S-adenosyl-L-methionine-dependent methyltransferase [Hypomontagnella submonticulosa]
MFGVRKNVRNIFKPRLSIHQSSPPSLTSRTVSSKPLKSQLKVSGSLADKLADTGVWLARKQKAKTGKSKIKADKNRVNIVSERLCDDIFSYVGSSLDRHKGCDILDIYPGAGLWSRKLHDYLQPRSHILMEPDAELYEPFLKPLLDRPNTTLIPASGILWRELNSVLTPEYLPHQTVPDATEPQKRNDTLLVTANIAFHPKKRFLNFGSLAGLVLYQFIDAIRTSSLFQRYGLVRMLIWARHDDITSLVPKVMQKRRKQAVDTDLMCEWVREVCGREGLETVWHVRDANINASSNLATWKRMQAAGMKMPKGRYSEDLKAARLAARSGKVIVPGSKPAFFKKPYYDVLHQLEAEHEEQNFDKESDSFREMRIQRWKATSEENKNQRIFNFVADLDAINALYKSGQASPEEIERLEAEWTAKIQASPGGLIAEFATSKDNLHLYRQDPPVLNWDRRAYDPMTVQPDEFFPNIHCSLLDIQPKAVHPLLRQTGPNSNRAGDCFELIKGSLLSHSTLPLSQTLDALMPGAADYIIPRWKSIRDIDHGGVLVKSRNAELTPRMLNARQWEELLELWMEWPFRPEFHELVARTLDEAPEEGNSLTPDI